MFRNLRKKWKGFTLVELLVVLVIIGILAAVATPIYLYNTKRAKASEALSTMGLIRQAQRDYKTSHDIYVDIAAGSINAVPPSGLSVDVGTAKYFSNDAYQVEMPPSIAAGHSGLFATPDAQDFLIYVKGDDSVGCTGVNTKCAISNSEVLGYEMEMDNSGRTYVRYGSTEAWGEY